MKKIDRNQISRYEIKYIIPTEMIKSIERYISIYCEKDLFSKKTPGSFYKVNSLYFDSENYHLLESKRAGINKRYNMRVRFYGDGTNTPLFFEIKNKTGDVVQKTRSKVSHYNLQEVLSNPQDFGDTREDKKNLMTFVNLINRLNVSPKIMTCYDRLAYFSAVDDYLRITFDANLKFCKQDKYNLLENLNNMSPYDYGGIFKNRSSKNVVLEIKTLTKVPDWIFGMIQHFDLNRRGFSKFENSINESNTEINDSLKQMISVV